MPYFLKNLTPKLLYWAGILMSASVLLLGLLSTANPLQAGFLVVCSFSTLAVFLGFSLVAESALRTVSGR